MAGIHPIFPLPTSEGKLCVQIGRKNRCPDSFVTPATAYGRLGGVPSPARYLTGASESGEAN